MSEVKVNKISPRTNCGTVTVGDSGDSVSVSAGVPVTVNGDLKSNALKAVDGGSIISQCGTNITLGASGDTINLAAGASQTGFGRTGTVDWDTTAKTAGFTAVSGNGYFVNTTSGAVTVTLPATPSAGDIVSIADYAGTAATNNITVARNGSNINGAASDLTVSKNNSAITLVYVDGTQGWKGTDTSNLNDIELQAEFIVATGGTITCCGDYKIHTFTGPGTFTVSCAGNPLGSDSVDYLVVAGGGGTGSGGGGAGGFRVSNSLGLPAPTTSPLANPTGIPVSVTGYPISVGGGGPGNLANGSNSIFSTITSAGGGGASTNDQPTSQPGGSGGGGGRTSSVTGTGGTGNTPPVSPPQGNPGGTSLTTPLYNGAGGGGAGAAGTSTPGSTPILGLGGIGSYIADTFLGPTAPSYGTPGPVGSTRYFAGGGGGGAEPGIGPVAGGAGGGGTGSCNGTAGTVNTGGGAGGGVSGPSGAAGGSGIVIIRYKFQ